MAKNTKNNEETVTAFDVTSEEFQKLVPEFDSTNPNGIVPNYLAVLNAVEREMEALKGLKDGDSNKNSPTELARTALLDKYSDDASEFVYNNIDEFVNWGFNSPKRFVALAEVMREWAEFFDYVGGLHVQDLRNSEYVSSSGSSDNAAEQRENVARLILNARSLRAVVDSFAVQGMGQIVGATDEVLETSIPTLQGVKVGLSGSGKRISSDYPVFESRMTYNVDGKDLKEGISLSDAIINHYFKAIGKDAMDLTTKQVIDGLKDNNENWLKVGNTTEFDYECNDGRVVTFRVTIVSK